MSRYVLDENGKPKPEPDLMKWSRWFEESERTVAKDTIGGSQILTVFLGLDHAFGGATPVLWETMVFGGTLNGEQDRCSGSREQAQAMHAAMLQRVRSLP